MIRVIAYEWLGENTGEYTLTTSIIIFPYNYKRGMIDEFEASPQDSPSTPPLAPQKIKANLTEAFQVLSKSSPGQAELVRAHQLIADMMKEEFFMANCIALLEEFQESSLFPNVPKLILTTLSTFMKHQQSSSRLVRRMDRHALNTALMELFFRRSVQEGNRLLVVKSYLHFIFAPGMDTIRTQTIDMLCNNFALCAIRLRHDLATQQPLLEDFVTDLMSYVMVGRTIAKGPLHHNQMKDIVKAFLSPVQVMLRHFLGELKGAIQGQDEPRFVYVSGVCERLTEFMKELVIGTSKESLYMVKHSIMRDPAIQDIIYDTLRVAIEPHANSNQKLQTLVLKANGNKYVERINEMKKNCVSIVNHFAKLCLSAQGNNKQLSKEEYQMPLQICRYFITNVPEVLIRQFQQLKYPQTELPHPGLYRLCITALATIIRLHQFFPEAFQLRDRLFYGLCLPLLQRKESDLYTSAQEFKGRREDILNMHNQDIPENAVCKLIESYVDRVDGSITHFTNALQNMIEFHLSANPNIFAQLPPDLTASCFFQQGDYLVQIESGLLVLGLFSYLSIGREQMVGMVEGLLFRRKDFFFSPERTGMFKSAVLLTYSYYVDNFYTLLKEGRSQYKVFHIEVLQHCCTFIEQFTNSHKIEEERKGDHLELEIGALQSLDCINNCIGQKFFLPALFFSEEGINSKVSEATFYGLFQFLVRLLSSPLNVKAIDVLTEFFVEAIRNQCVKGSALKRFHYQYKQVPMAIRIDVCDIISRSIYDFYGTAIPHSELMKSKIMTLLQVVLSCCEFPDLFMGRQFFELKVKEDDAWQVAEPIDIFLRRMIVFRQENRAINEGILQQIGLTAANLLQFSLRDYKLHSLLGILVNLMVLRQEMADDLAPFLINSLIQLLREEDESTNYQQDLQAIIQKIAYVNLIAIKTRFSLQAQPNWCALTEYIQTFLANRSSKGIIAAKSVPYVGKLLAISLVCIYHFKRSGNLSEGEQTRHLWTNILRTADVYSTTAEKQTVAGIFIELLEARVRIGQEDDECKKCFSLVAHVLYKAYSKLKSLAEEDYGDEREKDSSDVDSESEQEGEEVEHLNYKEYTIACNEYAKKEKKEKYITLFKNLCHKLKEESPEFLKNVVEALPLPIKTFVKTKVFYYEALGPSESSSLRKVIKVKKEIPGTE